MILRGWVGALCIANVMPCVYVSWLAFQVKALETAHALRKAEEAKAADKVRLKGEERVKAAEQQQPEPVAVHLTDKAAEKQGGWSAA